MSLTIALTPADLAKLPAADLAKLATDRALASSKNHLGETSHAYALGGTQALLASIIRILRDAPPARAAGLALREVESFTLQKP
jgi:hypothetical protein